MKTLTNLRIGRKIALALGGCVAMMLALCTLAFWSTRAGNQLTAVSIDRMAKARLAATVAADASAVGQDVGRMVVARKASDDVLSEIAEIRKERIAAIEEFRKRADSPQSIGHGAEMARLVQVAAAAADRVITDLRARHYEEAAQDFQLFNVPSAQLRATAREARDWQESRVAQDEIKRAHMVRFLWTTLIAGCVVVILGAVLAAVLLSRSIASPLATAVAHLERIAQGDLSQDAPAEFQVRGDEIGNLARAKQKMIEGLRSLTREIAGGTQVLASSSTELLASSTQLTTGSRNASDKANSVSAAAEEMSSNITSVAAGMEQTTTNLAHVAAATGEMTATIGEIAQNSEKARRITDEATRQAARINDQIQQLGAAAREIGKVTETITDISSQTNLLALNATIEAARAGAAGKGFAVVATEIKALAEQTAAATEDIKGRITGVQAATSGGIAEIEKVSQVIQEVNSIVASIAAAIEEQSAATKEIARNIAEASTGVNEANTRVAESSHVSREIAKDIASVNGSARDIASGGENVRGSAGELSRVAESLQATVAHFRIA
jgi:methyl-accepting chemotaxis protein